MSYMKQKDQVICACGNDNFIKLPIVLTSNPPTYVYKCTQCGEEQQIKSTETLEQIVIKIYR